MSVRSALACRAVYPKSTYSRGRDRVCADLVEHDECGLLEREPGDSGAEHLKRDSIELVVDRESEGVPGR